MTLTAGMTKSQKRRAYREAVRLSLMRSYGASEQASRELVKAWWRRISETSAFKSGLFMHSQPMNTAAGLVQKEVVPITSDVGQAYFEVLDWSRHLVLFPPSKEPNAKRGPQSAISVRGEALSAAEIRARKKNLSTVGS
jgi:hypothetical protein